MRHHSSTARWVYALITLTVMGLASPTTTWGQDTPAPATDTQKSDAAPTKSTDTDGTKTEDQAKNSSDAASEEPKSTQEQLNQKFGKLVGVLSKVLFFDITIGAYKEQGENDDGSPKIDADGNPVMEGPILPIIVVVLMLGGIFFTFRFGFINIRFFRHAIDVIRGRYDKPDDEGEVSHYQALTSALSATVGLGNIASVAIAISVGGPGAVFWMWLIAFFGMSSKFCSCAFGQIYRRVDEDGHVLGGPMVYLEEGFKERLPSLAWFGKSLAILFAVLTILGAFGGGNMFQGNQTYKIIEAQFMTDAHGNVTGATVMPWVVGFVLAFLAGLVLIGGIKRIGNVTSKLVPFMCVFYCGVCLVIILTHLADVPSMFASIISQAVSGPAMFGGFLGVLVNGAKRAAFSNEAGLGSAAIAHSAAKTDEPVREGIVAMVGPFIDTIVICTMTAMAILITGAHMENGQPVQGIEGVEITRRAFQSLGDAVPYILTLAVFIFAYSTIISWCYYGERATEYLFGKKGIMPYRVVYVSVIVLGPLLSLNNVIDFADMMLLSMAFPNIIGLVILSPKLVEMTKDYVRRLKSGEIKRTDNPGSVDAGSSG